MTLGRIGFIAGLITLATIGGLVALHAAFTPGQSTSSDRVTHTAPAVR